MKTQLRYYRLINTETGMIFSRGGVIMSIREIDDDLVSIGMSFCSLKDDWKPSKGIPCAIGRSEAENAAILPKEIVKDSLLGIVGTNYNDIAKTNGFRDEMLRRHLRLRLHKKMDRDTTKRS